MGAIGEAYRNQGYVFADELGNPPALEGPTKAFATAVRRLGIEGVTLHSCRHAVAAWAIASGCDARSVASLMGHSKPSTTLNVYSHAFAAAEQTAIEAVSVTLAKAQARLAAGTNGRG
jgi:integrase